MSLSCTAAENTAGWRMPSDAPRPGLQVARDERLHHRPRLVGLRSLFGDPFVLAALEQVVLDVAAGGAIAGDELLLERRQDVVVERALHDQERHQRDR